MPRYPGGGDYYLPPGTIAAPDTTIESTKYNVFTADVETELNAQIDKDAAQDAALAAISAGTIPFTPAGDIVATNVQDAIVEVDTEMHAADALRVLKAGDTMSGHLTLPTGPAAANAVRKDYVDAADTVLTSAKVAKAGDTMTGNLNAPSVRINGATHTWPLIVHTNANANIGFFDNGAGSSGFGCINDAASTWMPINFPSALTGLTVSGLLSANGGITTTSLVATSITSGYAPTVGTYGFGTNNSYYVTMDGSNFAFSSTPGGGIYCNNSLYNVTNITASGTVQGSLLNSTGNLSGVGITLSGSTAIGCSGYSGSNPYIIVVANFNPNWNQMSLQGLHYPGVWAGPNISIGDGNSVSFRNGGTAFKSGGASSWDGWSDARIKDIKGDYISSLDAVAALRPVRFTYKGNDTYALPSNYSDTELDKPKDNIEPTLPYANSPNYASARDQKEYVGLIAQEAELAMPELFFQTKAYIDGTAVDDLRNVNYSALTFALVNAIKELKARIEQLEGKDG